MINPADPDFTKTELFDGGKIDSLLGLMFVCVCLRAWLKANKWN